MSEELKNQREKIKTEIEILLANFALTYHKNLKFNNQETDYKIQEHLNELYNIMSTYKDDNRILTETDIRNLAMTDIDLEIIFKDDDKIIFCTNDRKVFELYDNITIYDIDSNTINIKHQEKYDYIMILDKKML